MTPREKAMELIDKYLCVEDEYRGDNGCGITPYEAKQCALISVDEMLSNDGWSSSRNEWDIFKKYCEEVKHEIEKI